MENTDRDHGGRRCTDCRAWPARAGGAIRRAGRCGLLRARRAVSAGRRSVRCRRVQLGGSAGAARRRRSARRGDPRVVRIGVDIDRRPALALPTPPLASLVEARLLEVAGVLVRSWVRLVRKLAKSPRTAPESRGRPRRAGGSPSLTATQAASRYPHSGLHRAQLTRGLHLADGVAGDGQARRADRERNCSTSTSLLRDDVHACVRAGPDLAIGQQRRGGVRHRSVGRDPQSDSGRRSAAGRLRAHGQEGRPRQQPDLARRARPELSSRRIVLDGAAGRERVPTQWADSDSE